MATEEVKQIKIDSLHVASFHKRSIWGDLPGLRDSILANGVLEPLIVRPRDRKDGGGYEIGAGVRRLKASTMAELKTVPCIVRELDDEDMIALQVDENRQREGLHPLDEADYCQELQKRGMANDAIATRLGLKKRNMLRRIALCALGPAARKAFVAGRFDEESALSLANLRDAARQKDILAALDAGTLQPEEITGYIRRTFTAPLDDVPWRKSDDQLVVKAGACSTCPKRSDVQRDLFPEGTAGLRCLDVDCWRSKMDATWAIEAAKPGAMLHDQPAESLFAPQSSGRPIVIRSSGMVDKNALCPHVENYTWEEALLKATPAGAEPPATYIARDQDGRPRYLYREAIVAKIVKKSDLARSAAESKAAQDPHREGADAGGEPGVPPATSPRTEGKIRRRLIAAIAERALADDHDTWPWVIARLLDELTPRAVSAAAELLGPAIRQLDPPGQDGAVGMVQLAGESNRQARRVATAALIFDVADVVGNPGEIAPLRELADLCGIDLAAIEAQVRGAS
jgi:ParB/RepB/Spo0J family partition protein